MKRIFAAAALALACALIFSPSSDAKKKSGQNGFRLLYWNIQNGMWSDQGNNYDNFVKWVSEMNPDVCVWCEAQTIYYTGTATKLPVEERYLVDNWAELAARYGHSYVYIGGHRDNYPQAITSKYPIENVARIVGDENTLVSHGAGWATINICGKKINVVTLHTWPQAYAFGVPTEKREESKAKHEGDYYRATEMQYILDHTINTVKNPKKQYWMMMGDFNSKNRVDNYQYNLPEDSSQFACQDVVRANPYYIDVIAEKFPGQFQTTCGGKARIDYVYLTEPMFKAVKDAHVIFDGWVDNYRDEAKISNFWHPSDHRPIVVDFEF